KQCLETLWSVPFCLLLATLSAPVLGPRRSRGDDRSALPFLCAPAEQNHDPLAVLAEVDPMPWAEIDLELVDALAYAFDTREISLAHPRRSNRHPRRRDGVQTVEPAFKRRAAIGMPGTLEARFRVPA